MGEWLSIWYKVHLDDNVAMPFIYTLRSNYHESCDAEKDEQFIKWRKQTFQYWQFVASFCIDITPLLHRDEIYNFQILNIIIEHTFS